MTSNTGHLKEDLLQVANGELDKDRYDSRSSEREHHHTNRIHEKIVVLIVGGVPRGAEDHNEKKRVEEVGVVGESAEWDPETQRKEPVDQPSVPIVTDNNDQGHTQAPSESRECNVEYVFSCTGNVVVPGEIESIERRHEQYPSNDPHCGKYRIGEVPLGPGRHAKTVENIAKDKADNVRSNSVPGLDVEKVAVVHINSEVIRVVVSKSIELIGLVIVDAGQCSGDD